MHHQFIREGKPTLNILALLVNLHPSFKSFFDLGQHLEEGVSFCNVLIYDVVPGLIHAFYGSDVFFKTSSCIFDSSVSDLRNTFIVSSSPYVLFFPTHTDPSEGFFDLVLLVSYVTDFFYFIFEVEESSADQVLESYVLCNFWDLSADFLAELVPMSLLHRRVSKDEEKIF